MRATGLYPSETGNQVMNDWDSTEREELGGWQDSWDDSGVGDEFARGSQVGYERDGERPEGMRTVLLIEDHVDFNRTLALRLRREGLEVIPAYDGLTGLIKTRCLAPDLIVLDLSLPRLGGFELLARLAGDDQGPCPPTLVLTANRDPEVIREAECYGACEVLYKPTTQRKIAATVKRILANKD